MLAFDLLLDGEIKKIPLIDGIIINQENSHQMWVLELFTTEEYYDFFNDYIEAGTLLDAQVIISLPENDPAPFAVVVHSITKINGHISVLVKGRLKAPRQNYAEQLLAQLLEEGLSNEALLAAFKQGIRERTALEDQQ